MIFTNDSLHLFSNSLLSNENIYFRKRLGNKRKRKFSASRAVFSCNILRGNKVTKFLLLIYLCLYNLYSTDATYFGNSLWHMLISWSQQLLGKTYGLLYQNGAMVSNSFAFSKTKSCRKHGLYNLRLTF